MKKFKTTGKIIAQKLKKKDKLKNERIMDIHIKNFFYTHVRMIRKKSL